MARGAPREQAPPRSGSSGVAPSPAQGSEASGINIRTEKAYVGWYAYNDDEYDGAPDSEWPATCLGYGRTEQEAIDEFCEARGIHSMEKQA